MIRRGQQAGMVALLTSAMMLVIPSNEGRTAWGLSPDRTLTILYTNNTNGLLDACG